MLRRFTGDLPRATAQSTGTKQLRVLSNAASLHTGSADTLFQLNITNPMSKNTQSIAIFIRYCTLFYMSKICAVEAVTAVLLTPCHWVAIAYVSKQYITVILTSQVDGVEFFTHSFPVLFESSLSTLATTQRNPRE